MRLLRAINARCIANFGEMVHLRLIHLLRVMRQIYTTWKTKFVQ
jgi:hypothetical protein